MKTETRTSGVRSKTVALETKNKAPKNSPRKNIQNTDLNSDQSNSTNATQEEDTDVKYTDNSGPTTVQDSSVEEEQDREALRKMEDAHPDEIMK